MKIHEVYPSSNVDPTIIRDYGWEFIENIPAIVNGVGRLAPTPERSAYHVKLREVLDRDGQATYTSGTGETVQLSDFALANGGTTERVLGFFALKPE